MGPPDAGFAFAERPPMPAGGFVEQPPMPSLRFADGPPNPTSVGFAERSNSPSRHVERGWKNEVARPGGPPVGWPQPPPGYRALDGSASPLPHLAEWYDS